MNILNKNYNLQLIILLFMYKNHNFKINKKKIINNLLIKKKHTIKINGYNFINNIMKKINIK